MAEDRGHGVLWRMSKSGTHDSSALYGFLADTWWYGLTHRMNDGAFLGLAQLRVQQGFTAVQLVAGIPPEVGPAHPSAAGPKGPAWDLDGIFNTAYLNAARQRIQQLNDLGLRVVVYGAWGPQIEWMGVLRMAAWWHTLVDTLDDLDVIYCLTGESNLWIDRPRRLLPNRSTGQSLRRMVPHAPLIDPFLEVLRKSKDWYQRIGFAHRVAVRRKLWNAVLMEIHERTQRPILLHPTARELSSDCVLQPELLAAVTAQTGHNTQVRDRIWQIPLALYQAQSDKPYINLEPWYEGILGRFGPDDQLFAYWASMLAGAVSHCYGAHGIWNAGDGQFLGHWGKQTFAEAIALDTPRLLGLSHRFYQSCGFTEGEPFAEIIDGQLIGIGRRKGGQTIQFYPEVPRAASLPKGLLWLPLEGRETDEAPQVGPVVITTG